MNEETRAQIMLESIKIGDEIINSAIKEEEGWRWATYDIHNKPSDQFSIYNGNAGIIIFLIELFKVTADEKYFIAIYNGCEWLKKSNSTYDYAKNNLSFFTGLGSIVYVFIEMYKLTNHRTYLALSIDITKNSISNQSINKSKNINDLLLGNAGILLTLLHLHNELDNELDNVDWILENIEVYIDLLLKNSIYTSEGICWDITSSSIRPLCGFSHGASGVAFIFVELAKYFNNDSFYWIAENAFCYEDHFFNYNYNNWPDFRQDVFSTESIEDLCKIYESNKFETEITPTYVSAWCHGAPGIGLSRLHAYKYKNDKNHIYYFNKCVNNFFLTKKYIVSGPLCHGLSGNAELLLNGYEVFNNDFLYNEVLKVALEYIKEKTETGSYIKDDTHERSQNPTLFLGNAGVGYFFLRTLFPDKIKSILIPSINNNNKKKSFLKKYTIEYIKCLLYENIFINISKLSPKFLNHIVNKIKNKTIEDIFSYLYTIEILNDNDLFVMALTIDKQLYELSKNTNKTYVFIKYLSERKHFLYVQKNIRDNKLEIVINSTIKINRFSIRGKNINILTMSLYYGRGSAQHTIGDFIYDVISSFNLSNSTEMSLLNLSNKYELDRNSQENFKTIYYNALEACFKKGFLIIKKIAV